MKRSKSSKLKAKEKAWKAFSIFIRTRDCIRFTGSTDRGMCITCKREYPIKQLQAGHFIAGRGNAVLFDEDAVYSQCYGCNVGRSGAHVQYFLFMEKEHTRAYLEEIIRRSNETIKYTELDYLSKEQLYKEKLKRLLAESS